MLCALYCARKRGVGRYVKEGLVRNAHLVKLIGYAFGKAVVVKEAVRYDKRLLFAHYRFKLVKGNGQTALLYINLLRRAEPQHIFSPFSDCFNIQKMLNANVFGNGVSAPASATERKRRRKLKVVQIAYAAVR